MTFLDLENFDKDARLSSKKIKDFNVCYSRIRREAQKKAKLTNCLLCGKKTTNFCNSHTIPQFILKNITDNGHFHYWRDFWEFPFFKDEIGMKNANVFHVICRECDNKVFSNYENIEAYNGNINGEMLREIALKNYLNHYAKNIIEYQANYINYKEKDTIKKYIDHIDDIMIRDFFNKFYSYNISIFAEKQNIFERNILDYERAISFTKDKKAANAYKLIFDKKLDYVVPIAIQTEINLIRGLQDELINNIFNNNGDYKIYPIHLCIFPFKDSTRIILFIQKNSKMRYRRFIKDFQKLKLEDKLQLLLYIILLYTDEFLLSDQLSNNVEFSKTEKQVFQRLPEFISVSHEILNRSEAETEAIKNSKNRYSLKPYKEVNNYLSAKYKVR